jgi:capsular polysaccharide biosynthesis protein
MVLRWWWLVLLSIVVSATITYSVVSQMTPLYRSSATFIVALRDDEGTTTATRVTGTYAQLLEKHPILETVISNLNLPMSPRDLVRKIHINVSSSTLLVVLQVEDTDPQRAANIANEMVNVLIEQGRVLLINDRIASRATVQFIEFARPPTSPFSPQLKKMLAFVTAAVAMMTIGLIWLIEQFTNALHSGEEIDRLTGMRTLVAVPQPHKKATKDDLPALHAPFSPIAEAYRLLQARLNHAASGHPLRTIVVTSGNDVPGRITVVTNLAVVMARSGKRVVLVDMSNDFSSLLNLFPQEDMSAPPPEQTTLTLDGNTYPLHATDIEHLSLLPGNLPSKEIHRGNGGTSEQHFARFCEELTHHADVVLFHAPAILASASAVQLAYVCDITLIVAKAGQTRAGELIQARIQFEGFDVKPTGVVLINTPRLAASIQSPPPRDGAPPTWGFFKWRRKTTASDDAKKERKERTNKQDKTRKGKRVTNILFLILPPMPRPLLALLVLILLFVVFSPWLLPTIGRFLIVSDPLEPADGVVALAGDSQRLYYAQELLEQGYAHTLIVTHPKVWEKAINRGVPRSELIATTEDELDNTEEEARAVQNIAHEEGLHSLIIVTSPYHTRRTRHIYDKIFRTSNITVAIRPVENHWYTPENWWKQRNGRWFTFTEYVKLFLTYVGKSNAQSPMQAARKTGPGRA